MKIYIKSLCCLMKNEQDMLNIHIHMDVKDDSGCDNGDDNNDKRDSFYYVINIMF